MAGTTRDIIPIVIVPVLALAFWLIMMFRADSHPQWASQAQADTVSADALEGSVPAQRLSSPGPVVPGQRPATAADEVTPEQARGSDTRGLTLCRWRPSATASAADGVGEDAAELDRHPVGPGVQFGRDVERELQAGQRPPLQVQVLLEDRHLILGGAFCLL
jgi:hypothetical protein